MGRCRPRSSSSADTFEHTRDGIPFCRCPNCQSKNALVDAGATPSQPGLVQVTKLLD